MRPTRSLTIAGGLIAAAIVGGTLVGTAAARTGAAPTDTATLAVGGDGGYCDLYLDTLAGELGVDAAELVPAARAAATTTINAMIEDGEIPADVGQRMLDRLADADGTGCAALGIRFAHKVRVAGAADWLQDATVAASDALGVEPHELRRQMRSGVSLADIAEAEGVDYTAVQNAVLDATRQDLDAAVEAGRLTQARADALLARVTAWLDGGGEPRGPSPRG
jgi:hypothetical protein